MSVKISKEELEEIDKDILHPLFTKWVKENKANPEKVAQMKEDIVGLIDIIYWHGHDAGYDDGHAEGYEDGIDDASNPDFDLMDE